MKSQHVILLATLAVVSWFLGDERAAIMIGAMVLLAIVTAFIQEHRSNEAAARLRTEIDSKPQVLDEVDRQIMQLEIEREALSQR